LRSVAGWRGLGRHSGASVKGQENSNESEQTEPSKEGSRLKEEEVERREFP